MSYTSQTGEIPPSIHSGAELSWDQVKYTLKTTGEAPCNWPFHDLPFSLDIGTFGLRGNDLVKQTAQSGLEHGIFMKRRLDHKLAISNIPTIGEESSVWIKYELSQASIHSELLCALLHTHPVDSPPSSTDVSTLLTKGNSIMLEAVYAPSYSYLMIRSRETTRWPEEEVANWVKQMKENYASKSDNLGMSFLSSFLPNIHDKLMVSHSYNLITEACRHHHIGFYMGVGDSTIFARKDYQNGR